MTLLCSLFRFPGGFTRLFEGFAGGSQKSITILSVGLQVSTFSPLIPGVDKNEGGIQFLVVPGFESCPPFRLLESRQIEVYNNSYFNTIAWQDCIATDNLPHDAPSFRSGMFSTEYVSPVNVPGNLIYGYYSEDDYHYWSYLPETGEYVRYQETKDTRNGSPEVFAPLVDRVNATPVQAANIVYVFAYHTFANTYQAEDEVYHIDMTGSGEAYVFRDGVGSIARWTRAFANQPLTLLDANGGQIYLKPGITFTYLGVRVDAAARVLGVHPPMTEAEARTRLQTALAVDASRTVAFGRLHDLLADQERRATAQGDRGARRHVGHARRGREP